MNLAIDYLYEIKNHITNGEMSTIDRKKNYMIQSDDDS